MARSINAHCPTQDPFPSAERTRDQLGFKHRFDDPDMDLFFAIACGSGSAGGLDIGGAPHGPVDQEHGPTGIRRCHRASINDLILSASVGVAGL
jgi:hypothetical protein